MILTIDLGDETEAACHRCGQPVTNFIAPQKHNRNYGKISQLRLLCKNCYRMYMGENRVFTGTANQAEHAEGEE